MHQFRPIEWCIIKHGDCKIEITGIASGNFNPTKTTKKCDLENITKKRARVIANFKTCNISLQNATFEDAGKWECELGRVIYDKLCNRKNYFESPTQERSITSGALFNEQLDQSYARNR